MIADWWVKRKSPVMPEVVFLPASGFIAYDERVPLAASWLFVAPGTKGGIGVIEFTTTNPIFGVSRILLSAVKALYAHLESVAWEKGCGSVISFVAQNGSEQHIMDKMGYINPGGIPHLIYGKARQCPSLPL